MRMLATLLVWNLLTLLPRNLVAVLTGLVPAAFNRNLNNPMLSAEN